MPNHIPDHLLFRWIVLRVVIWHRFVEISTSEKLLEIKSPLVLSHNLCFMCTKLIKKQLNKKTPTYKISLFIASIRLISYLTPFFCPIFSGSATAEGLVIAHSRFEKITPSHDKCIPNVSDFCVLFRKIVWILFCHLICHQALILTLFCLIFSDSVTADGLAIAHSRF